MSSYFRTILYDFLHNQCQFNWRRNSVSETSCMLHKIEHIKYVLLAVIQYLSTKKNWNTDETGSSDPLQNPWETRKSGVLIPPRGDLHPCHWGRLMTHYRDTAPGTYGRSLALSPASMNIPMSYPDRRESNSQSKERDIFIYVSRDFSKSLGQWSHATNEKVSAKTRSWKTLICNILFTSPQLGNCTCTYMSSYKNSSGAKPIQAIHIGQIQKENESYRFSLTLSSL